jgi:Vault protein inter-alpha-trypsin domain
MKNILKFIFFIISYSTLAQSPQLTIKNDDLQDVRMSQLLVNLKIIGKIAYTTTEMHFFNKGSRQMEGELLFPLPDGVSVSRYAIDINGKMREAVPVNKNKGKQVFEAIEHRRVDPGLLEKVDGNNFKTRIYPIMPNAERIVIIGYEQELVGFDKDNLAFQLVSKFAQKLDKFEINIAVFGGNEKPIIVAEDASVLSFEPATWIKSFQTSIKKIDYQPLEKLMVKIPIQAEIPSVVMQSINNQHYFYANTFVENTKTKSENPTTIGLIWDNSSSCKNRDLKKELEFLESYFKQIQNTKVNLYLLNYLFKKDQIFTITNGNWSALKAVLEKTFYDGGTRYSQIKFGQEDAFLFFTDGLSSLSNNQLDKTSKPVHTITSSVSSDFAFLKYNSLKTGGNFINLNEFKVDDAVAKMSFQSLKFLGIKNNSSVTEIYPTIGSDVAGNFSVSGISLLPNTEITLLFGYNNKVIIEKIVSLNAENQKTDEVNIEKLWAQKKIADLELLYKQNAEEIEIMGKKYGIITQNTSLIVLESLNDYIQYDITPPAELRPEFDAIKKQHHDTQLAKKTNNWQNIENYRYELQKWWNKDLKFKPSKNSKKPKVDQVRFVRPVSAHAEEVVEERQTGNEDLKGDPDAPDIIEAPAAVSKPTSITSDTVSATGSSDIVKKSEDKKDSETIGTDENSLKEVVVVKRSLGYSTTKISSNEVIYVNELSGKVAGVAIQKDNNPDDVQSTNNKITKEIETNSLQPDRLYLKILAAATKDKQDETYLELKKSQENNPNFYFDVANFYYNQGNKPKALLVLSNIADLGLENHQLYKSLTYVFRQWKAVEDALYTANQVAKWRDFEPQSHRDLGLTLEDNKQYQTAFDELIKALETNYFAEMSGQYEGIEDIILMDINRLVAEHPNIKTDKIDKKYLNKMPVEVRIILNWNFMDTDIDMHIIEPTGEECYYGHTSTDIGAKFSKDFTEGYGPEQYLLRNAMKGKYQIKTNFYGEQTLTQNGPTTVMVEIYITKNHKTERKLKTIQLGTLKENQNLEMITID